MSPTTACDQATPLICGAASASAAIVVGVVGTAGRVSAVAGITVIPMASSAAVATDAMKRDAIRAVVPVDVFIRGGSRVRDERVVRWKEVGVRRLACPSLAGKPALAASEAAWLRS